MGGNIWLERPADARRTRSQAIAKCTYRKVEPAKWTRAGGGDSGRSVDDGVTYR